MTVTDRTIDEDPGTAGLPLAPGGGYVVDMTVSGAPPMMATSSDCG